MRSATVNGGLQGQKRSDSHTELHGDLMANEKAEKTSVPL
jgi:hypothetical protein